MSKTIVVAGATGNLGGKIVQALLAKGATVKALVRLTTDNEKIKNLQDKGVVVCQVDTNNKDEMVKHCLGAHCVVSALSGLRDTIIDSKNYCWMLLLKLKFQNLFRVIML